MRRVDGGDARDVEYDPETNTYLASHSFDARWDLSETLSVVIETVADREGRPLSGSLYDVVDPDGLALFDPRRSTPRAHGTLSFTFEGFEIVVYADGRIRVHPPAPQDGGD